MQTDRCCWVGEGSIPSSTTQCFLLCILHIPGRCSGTNSPGTSPSGPLSPSLLGLRISFTSTPCFLTATATHFLRVQFKCAFTPSLEWAQWWTLQVISPDVAMFKTQSWPCLAASLSISMVFGPCYENQLNSGRRLWTCHSLSGLGTGFFYSFGWIC